MTYFAEIDPDTKEVLRVIVGPEDMDEEVAILWCASTLGGWWVPTWQGHPTERYAGKGMVYVPSDSRKFLYDGES